MGTFSKKKVRRFTITKKIWHREIIQLARQMHTDRWRYVADAGCGWTGLLKEVWDEDWENWPEKSRPILGVGFDLDKESIAQSRACAAKEGLPLCYLITSIEDLTVLRGYKFDVIFCWEVMYLLDNIRLDNCIASIHSILRSNGLFACGTLCHRSKPDKVMDSFYLAIEKNIAPYNAYQRLNTDYVKVLQKHGFSVNPKVIRVSADEYNTKIKDEPIEEFWFKKEEDRRVFYTEYGKDVWLCTVKKGKG
jgi:2-polyprenyl-3-methyl-5-hydroxy-6-metoxy-1,4-benzoquinol methylase